MSCQASARSASLPIGSNTAIARRAIARRASGVGRRAHEGYLGSLHLGSELGRLVVVPFRILYRLGESCVGGVERSGAAKRPAEVREQAARSAGSTVEEPARALEERGRRRELAAIERTSSRASEQLASLQGDRRGPRRRRDRAPRG